MNSFSMNKIACQIESTLLIHRDKSFTCSKLLCSAKNRVFFIAGPLLHQLLVSNVAAFTTDRNTKTVLKVLVRIST